MLGETYELITPQFRFFSEHVSDQPPVSVINCQGEGYEFKRVLEWEQGFTGKKIEVLDRHMGELVLDVGDTQETYQFINAPTVIGNLIFGERYCEP